MYAANCGAHDTGLRFAAVYEASSQATVVADSAIPALASRARTAPTMFCSWAESCVQDRVSAVMACG